MRYTFERDYARHPNTCAATRPRESCWSNNKAEFTKSAQQIPSTALLVIGRFGAELNRDATDQPPEGPYARACQPSTRLISIASVDPAHTEVSARRMRRSQRRYSKRSRLPTVFCCAGAGYWRGRAVILQAVLLVRASVAPAAATERTATTACVLECVSILSSWAVIKATQVP